MAIGYTSTNALLTSAFASLMKIRGEVRDNFYDNFRKAETFHDKTHRVEDSTRKTETFNTIGGLGAWASLSEGAEHVFNNLAQGTEVTATHVLYQNGFDVSMVLMQDNQWKDIMRGAKELARGGIVTAEDQASSTYDNAFTSGTGADGSFMCVTNHNLINSASTGSNAMTTALSEAGLEEAYVLGRNTVDEANNIIVTNFDTLIVPPALEATAKRLMKSTQAPESNNNAINPFMGMIKKLVVNPYLSSSTAWFLVDSQSENRPIMLWRMAPTFFDEIDVYSRNYLFSAVERFIPTFVNWQGVIGSTGTT